ncbi:hydroxymethylbilane synthase [Thermosynechococcus sp. QKsg1]|uniref:hydroxymethylbilane synthase n=1 Tax=unclassified Thermosynechococcus TaxID=2622553 RepID=UPI00122DD922|nr:MULTISPECIES: hydroxymethylbilane synthase [unclassified Thermosynechococcus]QEQ00938.1 hydroxymethylbilane synthase [Thermosynechococcus sp. CL-1]WJI27725.1 hydroxymethylbilane synthase [Thermosynechococcus sp. B1]WJI30258.1 hydroxymethylbilane synthase [Thermosynechococcus sp. B3]WNC87842.1 hydroxymethylbilane synthase [Thermosynechococcus sp. QKsg1]
MIATSSRPVRIGSRKSQLALVQTEWVQAQLQAHYRDRAFEVVTMTTQGDNILDVALAKIGDKGLFTKELELSMLRGETDLAVHSLKDLPTKLPDGLVLGAITEREDPADALILGAKWTGHTIDTLPEGTVIGTSSLRRLAQLRHHYPHLTFKDVRGNLNTRLAKLDAGEYDALILAVAGLRRLGFGDRISQVLPATVSLYAVGQGALGIECRADDADILALVKTLEHPETAARCLAERAFLRQLEGGCQVPIGVHTVIENGQLTLTGLVASLDGQRLVKDSLTGDAATAEELGTRLALKLREQGASEILEEIFATARLER